MKASNPARLWSLIFSILLLSNLIWTSWNLYRTGSLRASDGTAQFKVEMLHTNDISPWPYLSGNPSAVGLINLDSGKPAWAKWVHEYGEDADLEYYYFRGQHIFDVYWTNNGYAPTYDVYFRGPGKSFTWWRNRGGANTFNERVTYDTNGMLSEDQVWLSNTWHTVALQYGANGVMINGKWHQLAFDTNGMWMIETQADGQ